MLLRARLSGFVAPALVALALLARILVPAGFMPAADGRPGLVICTGQGAMIMPGAAMPAGHQAPDDGRGHQADHGCPFAAMAAVADAAATFAVPLPPFAARDAARQALRAIARPGLGLAAPPPPKTGPPAVLR